LSGLRWRPSLWRSSCWRTASAATGSKRRGSRWPAIKKTAGANRRQSVSERRDVPLETSPILRHTPEERTKECRGCGEVLSTSDFYVDRKMADGHLNFCKACVRARVLRNRGENIERIRAYDRRRAVGADGKRRTGLLAWRVKHPERAALSLRCAQLVRRAVAKGQLQIADACERCGLQNAPLEGAHFDYSQPLRVAWLCRPCHRKWDASQPKTRGA
jgi:hypothetical protein